DRCDSVEFRCPPAVPSRARLVWRTFAQRAGGNTVTESNLTTADLYNEDREVIDGTTENESVAAPPSAVGALERVTSRLSPIIAAGLAVAIGVRAMGFFTSAGAGGSAGQKNSTPLFDCLLGSGGAKDDQTFKNFVKDSSKKSKRKGEKKYRQSPAY